MKKLLLLISIIILTMASGVLALDAPHNKTNSFACGDCHSVTNPNDACVNCHNNFSGGGYNRLNAPGVLTHSSENTSSTYGTWSHMCSDCHNPHVQEQFNFFGGATWLATGTITLVTRDIPGNTTTYDYNGLSVLMPAWADPTQWGQKSKNERGLIIFPNIANVNLSAEILSATPTSITVTGYPGTVSVGSTFALAYGQLIGVSIRTPFGSTTAPLFTNTGINSFAFDESGTSIDPFPNGMCQVCHSQTQHWRRDGTLAAIGVHAGQNGANCTQCHPHEEGFSAACDTCHGFPPIEDVLNAASTGGNSGLVDNPAVTGSATAGQHDTHVNTVGLGCDTCHTGGMPVSPINDFSIQMGFDIFGVPGGDYDGRTTPLPNGYSYAAGNPETTITNGGAMSCSNIYCHSSGQGPTANDATPVFATPQWPDPATGDCGTCHKTTGGTALGEIDSASHSQHLNSSVAIQCEQCHIDAGDGTLYNSANHVNRSIDVANSYTAGGDPGNGYGTCSVAACHGSGSPVWGTDFSGIDTCTKCHGTLTTAPAADNLKAPPQDTAGDIDPTDMQVGAHQAHLQSLSNISSDINCNECHIVPGTVGDAGHILDATSGVAEIVFGTLATTNGASPSYGSQCSATYCHGNAMPSGTTAGSNKTPTWSDPNYLNGDSNHDCAQCHGYPPLAILAHTGATPTTCTVCHDHVNAAGTGFDDPSLHINGVLDGGGDNCSDCHTNANLSARHTVHTDPDTFLAGKSVSGGDWGNPATGWYDYSNTGGTPFMGCGNCHPNNEAAFHINGTKNLDFDPTNPAIPAGAIKLKHDSPESFFQDTGNSVTCSSVYCHSTGYDDGSGFDYQTSPDWFGGTFVGDKCANCHGNSPNTGGKTGSLSHYNPDFMGTGTPGGHFVGIHYNNVYTSTTGLIQDTNSNNNAHGDALTSTTINCQVCHNGTVTTMANDLNTICSTCHGVGAIGLQGAMVIAAASTTHVNGQPDVVFMPGNVRSKAQIRDDITTVTELNDNWTRMNGYKQANSYDESPQPLNASAVYDPGTKTCSTVACHNGKQIEWGATNISCESCHMDLP